MKTIFFKKASLLITLLLATGTILAQKKSIQDLDFLIGKWEVREDNKEEKWWEKSTRTCQYTLDSTYIELKSVAISSSGKERTYTWYIHYNSKAQQFEMVSMFSNWPKILFDILHWDPKKRKLIIQNDKDQNKGEYHERYGEIIFEEDFNTYTWTGQNKYGDPKNPSIWKYIEKGSRIK
ncbi:hypothetical protein [Aquimarina mytili]|uniref:DUF1579 domain-containing protein n=1 Tax=Aquimarina mytili TaxID=874423 RepID=A0A937A1P2_9FLAO|nr:hypothetical protein [Aquimarina mytili]MBL0685973.1 hypothetical protein [Aquimarina mytili]